ncbi:hypothetical protein P43SY_000701 [Pythium insidiosum]|uniref:Polycystin cation channel PKD1/PKD2 domain-containing protein n=1 Tax=Pythium insidiosum TaxID=114742 RepID=A0AAD5MI91_PYTIN|nr:hypothetical protein P43SY_000701 [Pythium insidiosum]
MDEIPQAKARRPPPVETTPPRSAFSTRWLLQALAIVLHVAVVLALTLRSTDVGNALHPFERALANEWIRLLFYVETTTSVPTWDEKNSSVVVPTTLPHFLLESEEEIAVNVDDEVMGSGFHVRASSYPVGMLFTIEETRKHLHGAVDNYFRLPNVALEHYAVAGEKAELPLPQLTVWISWNGVSLPTETFPLSGRNESEWPLPLQFGFKNLTATRQFFDLLDSMELHLVVGMKRKDDKKLAAKEVYEWWIRFTYDLQNQGHLEVAMNFGMRPKRPHEQRTATISAEVGELERHGIPPIFFDHNTVFDWCLLLLICLYQTAEFVLKWSDSQTAVLLLSPRAADHSPRRYRDQTWRAFVEECRDFWFWFVAALNIATMVCIFQTWLEVYRLYLWDTLCLSFAVCCALQWVSLVRYLRVNTRFHILGLTLTRGLPRVAQFLVGVFPIFVGYVLFGTIMFGAKVPRFQSAGTTATTLFSVANGDEIHDTFNAVAFTPWIGQMYVYSYLFLFSYVVLMVCIGIIEDAFFSAVFPASTRAMMMPENSNSNPIDVDAPSNQDGIRGRGRKAQAPAGSLASLSVVGDEMLDDDSHSDPDSHQKARLLGSSLDAAPLSHVQAVLNWWHSMRRHFGDALLLQIFFVYFTQGIRSTLCSLGTSYYLNETLALRPAQSEALRATAAIPWIIKPVYGMLSDTVPIWGTRRKSYLLIFSTLSALAYIALSLPGVITTYQGALVALVTASLGIAFCDVVIDGKVVEAARSEKEDMAGNLQTLSWISLSIGSVLGSMVSGFALNTFGPLGVFFLSALGPLCVIIISLRIPEENYHSNSTQSFVHVVVGQCRALAEVVVDPICWRPMLWIFLSNALPPSIGEAMFSFKTNELGFGKSFLGFISTVGSLTLLGTTAMYNAYFRDMPFRAMFFRIQLASAAVSIAEFVLVSRW